MQFRIKLPYLIDAKTREREYNLEAMPKQPSATETAEFCANFEQRLKHTAGFLGQFLFLWIARICFGLRLDVLWYFSCASYTVFTFNLDRTALTRPHPDLQIASVRIMVGTVVVSVLWSILYTRLMYVLWLPYGDFATCMVQLSSMHAVARILCGYFVIRRIRKEPAWWLVPLTLVAMAVLASVQSEFR